MSFLDITILTIVISFTAVGLFWGIIRQVLNLIGLVGGTWVASQLNDPLAGVLSFTNNPLVARGLAYIIIVVGFGLVCTIVATVLYFVLGLLFLGWIDNIGGAVLGFFEAVLTVGIMLVGLLTLAEGWTQEQLTSSFLAKPLASAFTNLALLFAPPELRELVQSTITKII